MPCGVAILFAFPVPVRRLAGGAANGLLSRFPAVSAEFALTTDALDANDLAGHKNGVYTRVLSGRKNYLAFFRGWVYKGFLPLLSPQDAAT